MTGDEHTEGPPPRGTTIARSTGRMLPVRPDGRVLLLRGRDPDRPDDPYWFTVGGGTDPGESHLDAAVRELAEETGLVVDPADVTAELGRYDVEFDWAGRRIVQDLVFFAVAVPAGTQVRLDGVTPLERASIDAHGWLTPDELAAERHDHEQRLAGMLRLAVRAVLGDGEDGDVRGDDGDKDGEDDADRGDDADATDRLSEPASG